MKRSFSIVFDSFPSLFCLKRCLSGAALVEVVPAMVAADLLLQAPLQIGSPAVVPPVVDVETASKSHRNAPDWASNGLI